MTLDRTSLGLLPRPWDCLGATVRGCSHPGSQGELKACQEEMHRCGFLSVEVQPPADQTTHRVGCHIPGHGDDHRCSVKPGDGCIG